MPVSGFDFFSVGELPVPTVSAADARRALAREFGVVADVSELGSQQDQNFLVEKDGVAAGVLKISNPAFTDAELAAQDAASESVGASGIVRTPSAHPAGGRSVATSVGTFRLRVLDHLGGGTFTGSRALSAAEIASFGAVAGHASAALRDFDHPGLDRVLQWNPLYADRAIALLASHIADPGARRRVTDAAAAAWKAVQAVAAELPRQPAHLDATDDNLIRSPDTGLADGLIDFGDVSVSWAVSELAITISSVLHHAGAEPHSTVPAVVAFHAAQPLSRAEIDALWHLVVLRGAVLVASGEQQLVIDGDANAYAAEGLEREWRIFEAAVSVPAEVMAGVFADALGFPPAAPALRPVAEPLSPGGERLDLSVTSPLLDDGAWLTPGLADRLARERLVRGAGLVATSFGVARLDRTTPLSAQSPATIATGIDVWCAEPREVRMPWPGRLAVSGSRVTLTGADGTIVIDGDDLSVGAGGEHVVVRGHAVLQVRAPGASDVPTFVRPEYAAGWLALVADPSPLIGLPAAEPPMADDLLARRDSALASVQEHYYADPPRIGRGWRHHLIDIDGRAYLDMVNNVAAIGHAHPRLTAAVARQLRLLNTNSRFHYEAVVEFSERLAATLPDPLDTVFLVNSGSEAADLSLRLAMAATGRPDIVALREAYHGWTYASDAVSTSIADNPDALATRPSWVHTVDAPNAYRGRHMSPDEHLYAVEAAAAIDALAAAGRPPAAFIAEAIAGNAGGIPLPDGYLAGVYAAIRRHGGLAIADEVQVGLGRLGRWFWGFEQQGVVPDIVAVAKSLGNGYPVGAVITSAAIADAYRAGGYFFSSTGGSPVSSVVGTTVLDVIRDEGLQANALEVGGHLRSELERLAGRHPLIGAVHGFGLYLGLELVRDRGTREPAAAETAWLCDRLLRLGVVMQPTGDHQNVLKIKPPLVIDRDGVDHFVAMLDRALGERY